VVARDDCAGHLRPRHRSRVCVTYAYDSPEDDVLRLCELLHGNGVEVWMDKWVQERLNWGHLTLAVIQAADYVLAIASPGYQRAGDGQALPDEHRGAQAEIGLLRELLQQDRSTWTRKILPVLLPGRSEADLPRFLHPYNETHYRVTDFTVEGAESLIRVLTNQPAYSRPDPGDAPSLPPRRLGRQTAAGRDQARGDRILAGGDHRVPDRSRDGGYSGTPGHADNVNAWARFAVVDHEELFGIDAEVERLGGLLGNRDGDWIISIFGAPGAGKTTLAYEVVKRHAARTGYRRIAWVSAKSAYMTSLGEVERERRTILNWRDMLLEIAAQLDLGISPNPMTIERELPRSLAPLADNEPCLVVVDNLETVQDARAAIKYMEQESVIRPHKVILTTRESAAQHSHRVRERRWDGLDPKAARRYAEYLGQDDPDLDLSRQDLDGIVAASDRIPLLIKLIIKLAIFERQSINDIVGRMRDNQAELGANIGGYLYGESLTALESKVGTEGAVKIMNVFCSKVGGESFTSEEFYRLSRLPDKKTFEQAKAAACQLALVRSLAGNTQFTVHGLLREFVCG
jgi:hypothetical protein